MTPAPNAEKVSKGSRKTITPGVPGVIVFLLPLPLLLAGADDDDFDLVGLGGEVVAVEG